MKVPCSAGGRDLLASEDARSASERDGDRGEAPVCAPKARRIE